MFSTLCYNLQVNLLIIFKHFISSSIGTNINSYSSGTSFEKFEND